MCVNIISSNYMGTFYGSRNLACRLKSGTYVRLETSTTRNFGLVGRRRSEQTSLRGAYHNTSGAVTRTSVRGAYQKRRASEDASQVTSSPVETLPVAGLLYACAAAQLIPFNERNPSAPPHGQPPKNKAR